MKLMLFMMIPLAFKTMNYTLYISGQWELVGLWNSKVKIPWKVGFHLDGIVKWSIILPNLQQEVLPNGERMSPNIKEAPNKEIPPKV